MSRAGNAVASADHGSLNIDSLFTRHRLSFLLNRSRYSLGTPARPSAEVVMLPDAANYTKSPRTVSSAAILKKSIAGVNIAAAFFGETPRRRFIFRSISRVFCNISHFKPRYRGMNADDAQRYKKVGEERTRGGECRAERHAEKRFGGFAAEQPRDRGRTRAPLRLRRDGAVILCRVEV